MRIRDREVEVEVVKRPEMIAEVFEEYVEHVYPDVVLTPLQREEIRRAYYAGALHFYSLFAEAASQGEELAAKLFDKFSEELRKFGESIKPPKVQDRKLVDNN